MTARRANGRPRAKIDYTKLGELCKIQCTAEECASVLGISSDALADNLKRDKGLTFPEFFKKHAGHGKSSLRRLQWASARKGTTAMLIWLGKQYLGQTDKIETETKTATAEEIARELRKLHEDASQ